MHTSLLHPARAGAFGRASSAGGLALMFVLAGCADPKAPTNENFVAAIDKFMTAQPMCERLPASNARQVPGAPPPAALPINIVDSAHAQPFAGTNDAQRKLLDELAQAGLFTKSTTEVDGADGYGGYAKAIRVPATSYTPTTASKDFVKADTASTFTGMSIPVPVICFGTARVDEILRATEPTKFRGQTVARAEYRWKVDGAPAWAKSPAVAAVYPMVARAVGDGAPGKATLVLTTEGWVDSRAEQ